MNISEIDQLEADAVSALLDTANDCLNLTAFDPQLARFLFIKKIGQSLYEAVDELGQNPVEVLLHGLAALAIRDVMKEKMNDLNLE